MATIKIHLWGYNPLAKLDDVITVRVPDELADRSEERVAAVKRSLERRTGLTLCTWSGDHVELSNGRPVADVFRGTLGRFLGWRLGGYAVRSEVWVRMPLYSAQNAP